MLLSSMTKKDQIMNSIQNLDIESLYSLLDDTKTYQGVTKEAFLKELNKLFSEFKSDENTHLIPQKSVIKDDKYLSEEYHGYCFVGNISRT